MGPKMTLRVIAGPLVGMSGEGISCGFGRQESQERSFSKLNVNSQYYTPRSTGSDRWLVVNSCLREVGLRWADLRDTC